MDSSKHTCKQEGRSLYIRHKPGPLEKMSFSKVDPRALFLHVGRTERNHFLRPPISLLDCPRFVTTEVTSLNGPSVEAVDTSFLDIDPWRAERVSQYLQCNVEQTVDSQVTQRKVRNKCCMLSEIQKTQQPDEM